MSVTESPPPTDKPTRLVTAEEFWGLPDDGSDRELIDGVIYVWEPAITVRNCDHSRLTALLPQHLGNWLDATPERGGMVVSGEAGFRLKGPGDSLVGIDVAYVSADVLAVTDPSMPYFNGPPRSRSRSCPPPTRSKRSS